MTNLKWTILIWKNTLPIIAAFSNLNFHDFGNSNPWSSQIFGLMLFPGWSWQDLHCIGSCTTHCWGQGTTELTGVETWKKIVKLFNTGKGLWKKSQWNAKKLPLKLDARTRRFQAQCDSSGCAVLKFDQLFASGRSVGLGSSFGGHAVSGWLRGHRSQEVAYRLIRPYIFAVHLSGAPEGRG